MFFKFQSVNTPMVKLFLEAFPTVPWIYIYRDPVEVLASQFKKGDTVGTPPCARGYSSMALSSFGLESDASKVDFCAAKLGKYGDYVINALEAPGVGPGVVINYKHLPDALIDVVLGKHFSYGSQGVPESSKNRMREQSHVYSKARSMDVKDFVSDSKHKHDVASDQIQQAANKMMYESYNRLETFEKLHRDTLMNLPENAAAENEHAAAVHHMERRDGGAKSHDEAVGADSETHAIGRELDQFHVNRGPDTKTVHWTKVRESLVPRNVRNKAVQGLEMEQQAENEHLINGNYIPFPDLVPLQDLLERWPPDEPDPPDLPGIAEGSLPRFDYMDEKQRAQAKVLQTHEVPFMIYNVPNVNDVVKKWNDEYLVDAFGDIDQHVLKSSSNHFMYWNKQHARRQKDTYSPPTKPMTMKFKEFLQVRDVAEKAPVESEHVYLQLNSDANHRFIQEDLPMFKAQKSFWIVEAHKNRGINCRWGSRGLIAEAHYDGGRNFIAMLKGAKRYVLAPPSACPSLYLWPKGHPEGRHAKADWSNLDLDKFPEMKKAQATEVIVREGEVLYIPSYWFHYIISLGGSIQCNTRSGNAIRGRDDIKRCGFY